MAVCGAGPGDAGYALELREVEGVGGSRGEAARLSLQAVLALAYLWALSLFHPRRGTEAQLRDVD